MTCYFRHLKRVFQKAGITITPQNRRQIDKIIHTIVNVKYKNCPTTWHQVKKRIAEDDTAFVTTLKNAWNNQQEK